MADLVALDLSAGQGFVDALLSEWEAGNAVLPIDQRLSGVAADRLLDALHPSAVIDGYGFHPRSGGRPAEPGDALVVATSGTTGEPKGVVLTHSAVHASAAATYNRLAVDPGRDRWVACLPLAHIGGLSVLTRALVTHTPYALFERFDAAAVEEEARRGATLVSLVATALRRTDTHRFRSVLLGGAAPPELLPGNVITTYGMTETGSGVVYDGMPLEGVDLLIGDGRLGAEGEVLVRGPSLMRSYRDGTDPRLPGGWLPTGDAGRLAGDGRLSVFGRIAEVIVTGAEKVWPSAVEGVLSRHPDVDEVAVWKRPDAEWGERVVAWVVPVDPSSPPTLGSLRAMVSELLAPWAAPKELVVVDALPRTPIGKVLRRALA
ncbi:MAG: class I adenylate-forming enzyme family protein [Acidimicrobiales bacterium]